MTYPITDLNGIDEDAVASLKSVGIRTTERLLEAAKSPKGRKELAARIGLGRTPVREALLCWANMADRMRLKGLGRDYAELLQAAGVDTVKELKYRNPEKLAKAMATANATRKLVRLLPSDKAVTRWIEQAKRLPLKITY